MKLYLNDGVVFSKNVQKHDQHLRQVILPVFGSGLQNKVSKCEFVADKVVLLEHAEN